MPGLRPTYNFLKQDGSIRPLPLQEYCIGTSIT